MDEQEFRTGKSDGMKNPYKKPDFGVERVPMPYIPPALQERRDDPVNHPAHYTSHPSGVECITVTEHMNFNVGNAIKYLWRAGIKTKVVSSDVNEQHVQDLKKAAWYINREIERLTQCTPSTK